MWVFIYFLIGILLLVVTSYIVYRFEEGEIELRLKDIGIILLAMIVWPISLIVMIGAFITHFSDKVVISIKKKEKEE